jgi:hypothetical protein
MRCPRYPRPSDSAPIGSVFASALLVSGLGPLLDFPARESGRYASHSPTATSNMVRIAPGTRGSRPLSHGTRPIAVAVGGSTAGAFGSRTEPTMAASGSCRGAESPTSTAPSTAATRSSILGALAGAARMSKAPTSRKPVANRCQRGCGSISSYVGGSVPLGITNSWPASGTAYAILLIDTPYKKLSTSPCGSSVPTSS